MMEGTKGRNLEERVAFLEAEVAAQGEMLRVLGQSGEKTMGDKVEASSRWELTSVRLGERYGHLLRAEWWLTRGGVVLLLFGLLFLFKLSVDEGWITPLIRVLMGTALGVGLVGGGLRVHRSRTVAGQAMIGGGIAALYASTFAATTLYSLLPVYVAFILMVAVTAISFSLALGQDASSLSVLGVTGGLATPFLVSIGGESVTSLVVYVSVVFTGAAAVYLYKGWNVLLASAASGMLLCLAVAYGYRFRPGTEVVALISGVLWCWILAAGVPILRSSLLRIRRPVRPFPIGGVVGAFILTASSVSLIGNIVEFSIRQYGVMMLCVAVVYLAGAWTLHRSTDFRDGQVSYAHLAGAVGVTSIGLGLALPMWVFVISLAALAAILLHVAKRYSDSLALGAGHVCFIVSAAWFLQEVAARTLYASSAPVTYTNLVAMFTVMSVALFVAVKLLSGRLQTIYLLAVHTAFLAWLLVVLSTLPNSGMLTTIAWGLYGAGLLVGSLRMDGGMAFNVSIATLVLVVAKLFIVDLLWVEAIFRVMLFVLVGGMFLTLGYYLRRIWKPHLEEEPVLQRSSEEERAW